MKKVSRALLISIATMLLIGIPLTGCVSQFEQDSSGETMSRETDSAPEELSASPILRDNNREEAFTQTTYTLNVDGRERVYIVHAPEQYDHPLPVVFLFHGGNGSGEAMAEIGFREMVSREGFIGVYPTGWHNYWNDGRNSPLFKSHQEGVDDVKFVRSIVEDMATRYTVDRSRIFATGGSNGGLFCHYLAAQAADLFAGIAPIIGGLAEPVAESFNPSDPISLMVIQGGADPLLPIDGGALAGNDQQGRIIPTEEMLELYLASNGISGEPTEELLPDTVPDDGCRTLVRRYPPGNGNVKVEYWLIQGAGHAFPGYRFEYPPEKVAVVGRPTRDFDGLEVVWDFFKSCPGRGQ